MIKNELIDKVHEFCDSDDLEVKRKLKKDILDYTQKNNLFKDNLFSSSFNTMILAHFDAFRMSKIKTSKDSIIGFIERHYEK